MRTPLLLSLSLSLLLLSFLSHAHASPTVNVQTIASAVRVQGTLSPAPDSAGEGLSLDLYRMWVPKHTVKVSVDFIDTDACTLEWSTRTLGLPCPNARPYSGIGTVCRADTDAFSDSHKDFISQDSFPKPISGTRYLTDVYWYFGVGRKSTANNAMTCHYNFTATLTTCASATQIDFAGTGDRTQCTDIVSRTLPLSENITNVDSFYAFNVSIPADAGLVTVVITSANGELLIIMKSNSSPTTAAGTDATDTLTSISAGITTYTNSLKAPRMGQLNVLIINQKAITEGVKYFSASISATVQTCSGTQAGSSCAQTLQLSHDGSVEEPAGSYYYWRHVIAPQEIFLVSITISQGSGQGTIYMRQDGYPFATVGQGYDGLGFTAAVAYGTNGYNLLRLSEYDTYEGGIYYFAVQSGADPMRYMIAINPVVTTSSTTTTTTTSTSTSSSDSTSTSSSSTSTSSSTSSSSSTTPSSSSTSTSTRATTARSTSSTTNQSSSSASVSVVMLVVSAIICIVLG